MWPHTPVPRWPSGPRLSRYHRVRSRVCARVYVCAAFCVQVNTGNRPGDGVVDVFSGTSPTSLAWLAGARHGGNTSFVAAAGLVYYVRVEGVGNSSGEAQVTVTCWGCAPFPSATPAPGGAQGHCSRLPAIISVTSTLVASVAMVGVMALQVVMGVSEALVGVAGVGLEYGGVGGGILGLDLGLLEASVHPAQAGAWWDARHDCPCIPVYVCVCVL